MPGPLTPNTNYESIRRQRRKKELIPRKVCPDGSVRPSNIPCPLTIQRPGKGRKPITRAEQFKRERLGR
tara:strand:- start:764 stop:970 length:207 start_codon:yes stop_codon:yes gene_type:complete